MKPPLPLTAQTERSFWRYFHINLPFWLRWLLVLEDQNLSPYPEPHTTWNLPLWLRGLNRRPSVWSPSSSQNQRPEIIPEPIRFPGMAHLFPDEPERLLLPSQGSGSLFVRSADRAQEDSQEKLFVHFNPATQMFLTHFRRWVAETNRLTY